MVECDPYGPYKTKSQSFFNMIFPLKIIDLKIQSIVKKEGFIHFQYYSGLMRFRFGLTIWPDDGAKRAVQKSLTLGFPENSL